MVYVFIIIGLFYFIFPLQAWKWGKFSYSSEFMRDTEKEQIDKNPSRKVILLFRFTGLLFILFALIFNLWW